MRRLMTNWMNDDSVGYGGLGTLSPAPVHSVDWSTSGTALTNNLFSTASLDDRMAWLTLRTTLPNVCLGSLADIRARIRDVRFTPKSGHAHRQHRRPLSAKADLRPVNDAAGSCVFTGNFFSTSARRQIEICIMLPQMLPGGCFGVWTRWFCRGTWLEISGLEPRGHGKARSGTGLVARMLRL